MALDSDHPGATKCYSIQVLGSRVLSLLESPPCHTSVQTEHIHIGYAKLRFRSSVVLG
jgi:hypothetical protein